MAGRPWMRQRVQAFPLLRAPDGSAFEKCSKCGVTVAIALTDMHKCKVRKARKRPRDNPDFIKCGQCGIFIEISSLDDHPHECDADVFCGGSQSDSTNRFQHELNVGNKSLEESKKRNKQAESSEDSEKESLDIRRLPRSAFRFFMESFVKTCDTEDWFEIDRKGFRKWVDMTSQEQQPYTTEAKEVDDAYARSVIKEMKEMAVAKNIETHPASFANYDNDPHYFDESSSCRWKSRGLGYRKNRNGGETEVTETSEKSQTWVMRISIPKL